MPNDGNQSDFDPDNVDFDDLPGMERDDPPPEDTNTPRNDPTSPSTPDTSGQRTYGEGGWTNEELNEWFTGEVGGEMLLRDWSMMPDLPSMLISEDGEYYSEDGTATGSIYDSDYESSPDPEVSWQTRMSSDLLAQNDRFGNYDPRLKAKFREWYEKDLTKIEKH